MCLVQRTAWGVQTGRGGHSWGQAAQRAGAACSKLCCYWPQAMAVARGWTRRLCCFRGAAVLCGCGPACAQKPEPSPKKVPTLRAPQTTRPPSCAHHRCALTCRCLRSSSLCIVVVHSSAHRYSAHHCCALMHRCLRPAARMARCACGSAATSAPLRPRPPLCPSPPPPRPPWPPPAPPPALRPAPPRPRPAPIPRCPPPLSWRPPKCPPWTRSWWGCGGCAAR